MASGGDIHSILYRGDPLQQSFEPRFDPSKKVRRYFPGKAPCFEPDETALLPEEPKREAVAELRREGPRAARPEPARPSEPIVDEEEAPADEAPPAERPQRELEEARRVKRRRVRELVEAEQPQAAPALVAGAETTAVDVESAEARRQRIRQAALERQKREEQELLLTAVKKQESEAEDEGDSEETDYASEDEAGHLGLRPIFIPAAKRETVQQQREAEVSYMGDGRPAPMAPAQEAEKAAQAEKAEELRAKREDSRRLLISTIQKEEEEEKLHVPRVDMAGEPEELPDDEDGQNEEAEYELWKIRELKRIKRDKEEAAAQQTFTAELERRRNMTEVERSESDRLLDAQKANVKKGKYSFLQKYYHRGAFYQDLAQTGAEPLYLRDVNQAVGEDALDKKVLPRPMQLRRGQFGKAGRVKHTHLVDVDTTDFSSAWAQRNAVAEKKMAGIKAANELQRPSATAEPAKDGENNARKQHHRSRRI